MGDRTFDIVIVGGGSAGCVVAETLSRCGRFNVCLIEAGPPDRDPRIKIPFGLIGLMKHRTFDWRFESRAHAHLSNRVVPVPRGRTLGGSGSINSMVYIRGRPNDYDRWAELGATGWGWKECLAWFRRQENNARLRDDPLHGVDGPLHVQDLPSPHPLLEIWQRAGEAGGIARSCDFNGQSQEGLGVYQTTMRNGRRWSAADAFLRPATKRPNLTVLTGIDIRRIEFDGRRAVAVHGRRSERIGIRQHLVLSTGAIASPALLMASGVGPGDHLQSLGIDVVHDSPSVGRNLHDHPAVAVFHGGGRHGYGLSLSALPSLIAAPFQYAWRRRGLLASNTVEGGGFARSDATLAEPDVQFHLIPARLGHKGRMIVTGRGYYCDVCVLKPRSRGRLMLKDPTGAPDIDLNLLSDPHDRATLLQGLKTLRALLASPAFDPVRSKELAPGPDAVSDEALTDYIHARLGTAYHPVGTCRMGSDPEAVVAPDLSVNGLANVRVIDASVMPEIVAGNTNAPTMMLAGKGAQGMLASIDV